MSGSGFLSSLLASTPAPAALEITARRINAVSLAANRTITAYVSEPLPDGLVTPALNATNVHDHNALAAAVKAAADGLSPRPRRLALVLPDTVAKVSLVRFEKTPPRAQDLDQLIKWQVRKAAPFRIEDAQVAWSESGPAEGGGREYLVVLARRDIIDSYERACDTAGVHPGVVDIASLNIVNAALAIQPTASVGDWLLIHIAPGYATITVVRAGRVMFFRNRQSEGAAASDLDDLVHQTAMYHEDRLAGAAFTRVILSGATTQGIESVERTRRQIEDRLGVKVEMLDVLRGGVTLRDRIAASPELIDNLAPAVGVLLRERPASTRTRAEQVA
jgi:type IV pilus assembly protein PilM